MADPAVVAAVAGAAGVIAGSVVSSVGMMLQERVIGRREREAQESLTVAVVLLPIRFLLCVLGLTSTRSFRGSPLGEVAGRGGLGPSRSGNSLIIHSPLGCHPPPHP
jgi:hypothetical protein